MSLTSFCLVALLASCSSGVSQSTPPVASNGAAVASSSGAAAPGSATTQAIALTATATASPSGSASLAQAPKLCPGSEVCTLAKAPTNGDVLSVVLLDGAEDLGSVVVKDSLGHQLALRQISPNCSTVGHCAAVFDEVVSGSPSATITLNTYNAYRAAIYDIAGAKYPGSYAGTATGAIPLSLIASIPTVTSGGLQICGYIQAGNSVGDVALKFTSGTATYDTSGTGADIAHATAEVTGASSCTATNLNTIYSAGVAYADYSGGGTVAPTAAPSATPTKSASGTTVAGEVTYNATSMCINNTLYTNNVLPSGVGEFATNGLDRGYWGGTKSRTYSPVATWGPGFYPSWGRHQYDTYFGDSSDGLGLDPFTVTNDTAVAGSPQALRITAEPLPSNIAKSLTVLDNDQWQVTSTSGAFKMPAQGGTLVVDVANPDSAQNGWYVGVGYKGSPIMFVGKLTSGGATTSGNGTGGSNPWTITNIQVYAGTPGTTITPGVNDEGGLRAYNFPDYYSGALDTNVNLRYGFFVARVRLPAYLPALSPAFWTLETGGVASNAKGLERDELDIQEMFANVSGNSMNAGQILWNTPSFAPTPTGVYSFPNGTPQSAYHDYGVLLTPGSTTFYLDGVPIAGHSGGPDWTQGSPDKEIMLMFQVGAPKTWLDPSSLGASNSWPQYYWAQWIRIFQPTTTACT